MQGEDIGWSGRGRVRGRSARVQRGGEPAGVQLPRRRPDVQVRLPSAVLDWARQAIARRRRPVLVSSSRREGKTQITTIVPRANREERKVSGPRQSGERQGREMLCKTGGGHLERGEQSEGCAGRTGSRVRFPGGERRGALSKVQGRRLVRGRRGARANTGQPAIKRAENMCRAPDTPGS